MSSVLSSLEPILKLSVSELFGRQVSAAFDEDASARSSRAPRLHKFSERLLVLFVCVVMPWQILAAPSSGDLSSNFEPRKLRSLKIEGNKKIETDAIEAKLSMKVGQYVAPSMVEDDIKTLFKLGYFYDVQIFEKGTSPFSSSVGGGSGSGGDTGGSSAPSGVSSANSSPGSSASSGLDLILRVVEKPSVVEVVFEGNSELKSEELQETSGLKNYEVLNLAKIREAKEKIQKAYEDKGYFLARVDYRVEDVTVNESVKIVFKITENDKVKVAQVQFLGNQKIKSSTLKSRLETKERGFFSFMSNSGQYKQDVLEYDLRVVRVSYLNEGFVKAQVQRPQVYVTPDRKSIYITYQIEEGEQYDVGDVDFEGDLLFSKEELAEAIQINKRKVFSYEVMQKDLSDLQAKYGDLGYAFANVIPRMVPDDKEKKVHLTFEFDKGNKVYFGRINVVGNTKTRDKVIRRELKIREGELYHETRKRQSIERIKRLGFFEEEQVVFKQSTPPETPDILNIDISVKERNTGTISLGAGYGSLQGFALNGQVTQGNFRGLGQNLGASLNLSRDISTYSLSFTEPAFLDSEWRLGGDVYQTQVRRSDYQERRIGGAIRTGYPLSDDLILSGRYKYETIWLEPYFELVNENLRKTTDETLYPLDLGSGVSSSITGALEYDTRNDRLWSPSAGLFASTSLEYSGLGGKLRYTKNSNTFKYFKKLFWDVVWRNHLNYSLIHSPDDVFNELFLLGGSQSLRGYRWLQIGRTRFSDATYQRVKGNLTQPGTTLSAARIEELAQLAGKKPYGGRQQLLLQTETEFPLIQEAKIKGVFFLDVGQAEDELRGDGFYSGTGFGFRWFSPLGPLRFEWGFPLRSNELSPESMIFDFMIGNPF